MQNSVVSLLAQVDDLGFLAGEVFQLGAVGAAMVVAYRVTARAYRDAVASSRESASDAAGRLRMEREQFTARERVLLDQISAQAELIRALQDDDE